MVLLLLLQSAAAQPQWPKNIEPINPPELFPMAKDENLRGPVRQVVEETRDGENEQAHWTVQRELTYDRRGTMIKLSQLSQSVPACRKSFYECVYHYDASHRPIIEEEFRDGSPESTITYKYSPTGDLLSISASYGSIKTFEYDNGHHLRKSYEAYDSGEKTERGSWRWSRTADGFEQFCHYAKLFSSGDFGGSVQIDETRRYGVAGGLLVSHFSRYGGKQVEDFVYYPNGTLRSRTLTDTESGSKIVEDSSPDARTVTMTSYEADGKAWMMKVERYDQYGNVVSRNGYNEDGSRDWEMLYEYKYDRHGNWTLQMGTDRSWINGEGFVDDLPAISRTITYFHSGAKPSGR